MDKLNAMETFVAIVEEKSLTAAARRLDRALPTVVRTLSLLEEELGVRLLQRTTRRQSLTPEGRAYLSRCRQILSDVASAEAEIARSDTKLEGPIRMTAPALFGSLVVTPLIAEFMKKHPGIQVELVLLDRVVDLVEEGLDLGVRIAPLSDSSLIAVKVGELRRVVVGSPELMCQVNLEHPRDLTKLPVVWFSGGAASGGKWQFQEEGERLEVAVTAKFSCNQAAAGVIAASAGVGFGRFLSYQVAREIQAGQLRIVLEEFEDAPIPVHVVFAHARLLNARTRALVEHLKTGLRSRL